MPERGTLIADAWVTTAHGDPAAVMGRRDVKVPVPGPDQVRVAVARLVVRILR